MTVKVDKFGRRGAENTPPLGNSSGDVMKQNRTNFRIFGPDETTSNKLR